MIAAAFKPHDERETLVINVLELLRPVREKKIDRLEELADRLIAGENISPEVIDQCIREAHREPGELQAIVERKTRAAELAKVARSGGPAKTRLHPASNPPQS